MAHILFRRSATRSFAPDGAAQPHRILPDGLRRGLLIFCPFGAYPTGIPFRSIRMTGFRGRAPEMKGIDYFTRLAIISMASPPGPPPPGPPLNAMVSFISSAPVTLPLKLSVIGPI
jgi:hypothetical protein